MPKAHFSAFLSPFPLPKCLSVICCWQLILNGIFNFRSVRSRALPNRLFCNLFDIGASPRRRRRATYHTFFLLGIQSVPSIWCNGMSCVLSWRDDDVPLHLISLYLLFFVCFKKNHLNVPLITGLYCILRKLMYIYLNWQSFYVYF